MNKQRESKLDRYAAALLQMDDEKKTIAQIQSWLKEEGCVVSAGSISNYLAGLRQRRLQDALLGQIASGARQSAAVEKQFSKNPAPELETLIKLQRVILLQLSTQANANPEFLELIGNSFKAVLESEKLKLKRAQLYLAREEFEFQTCEKILKAIRDKESNRIAELNIPNEEKIQLLRQHHFSDVDELEKSGTVKIPK
ncbi:MAG TPA: hypothetical protein VHG89_03830 [Verrucomicrobiae bacterium]|nr:hypothetical protein [Verrucomicrobiae bacterium]